MYYDYQDTFSVIITTPKEKILKIIDEKITDFPINKTFNKFLHTNAGCGFIRMWAGNLCGCSEPTAKVNDIKDYINFNSKIRCKASDELAIATVAIAKELRDSAWDLL